MKQLLVLIFYFFCCTIANSQTDAGPVYPDPTPVNPPVPTPVQSKISINLNIINNSGVTVSLDGDVVFILGNPDVYGNYYGWEGTYNRTDILPFNTGALTLGPGETRVVTISGELGGRSPLNPSLLSTVGCPKNILLYDGGNSEVVLADNMDSGLVFQNGQTYNVVITSAPVPAPTPAPEPQPTPTPTPIDPTPVPTPTPTPTPVDPTPVSPGVIAEIDWTQESEWNGMWYSTDYATVSVEKGTGLIIEATQSENYWMPQVPIISHIPELDEGGQYQVHLEFESPCAGELRLDLYSWDGSGATMAQVFEVAEGDNDLTIDFLGYPTACTDAGIFYQCGHLPGKHLIKNVQVMSNLSGQCGDNVYYFYDKETHTLTISGKGPMWDNEYEPVRPWSSYRDDIQHVKIDFGVTSIGRCAFDGCSGLTSIIIPNSVKSIEWNAFWGCTGLTSITLPESLTVVDEYAFNSCNNLAAVYISDLEAYLKIVFKDGDFPSNPLYYAHHLFLSSKEIIDLVIPNGVTYIGSGAFINGSSLKSVYIPNSVTWIRSQAFRGCTSLTFITIPSSVTSIERGAFSGCSNLTNFVSEIEKPFKIDNSVFNGIPSDAQLIVPKGTKAAYQATEGWNQFARITEAGDTDEALFTIDDITYQGTKSEKTVAVKAVDTTQTSIEIPASVSYDGITFQVSGITDSVFDGSSMAALIWDVEAALPNNAFSNASIGSNFLLYVKSATYAPSTVKNVVVDGTAQAVALSDNGGSFYCPQTFIARSISYTHNFTMETGGSGKGWESLVLPFFVQKISHSTRGEIVPFALYSSGSSQKPFWLAKFSGNGFKRTSAIEANEPYIIAMPNSKNYRNDYNLAGEVTFSAENAAVPKTPTFDGAFVPAFAPVAKSSSVKALNNASYSGGYDPGSRFIPNLRDVHPFEAYMTGSSTRGIIEISFDDGTTDMLDILLPTDESQEVTIHTLSGQQITRTTQRNFDAVWQQLPKGVYIINGKKWIK